MAVERTCEHCGNIFKIKASKAEARKYCTQTCFGLAHRKSPEQRKYRAYVGRPDHPLAQFATGGHMPAYRVVLYDKIGAGPHPCHWCGTILEWKKGFGDGAITADHLNGNFKDDSPDNLVPACAKCNTVRSRRLKPDELFLWVKGKPHKARAIERTCEECGVKFLAKEAFVKRGEGRFCNRKCAARWQMRVLGPPNRKGGPRVPDGETFIETVTADGHTQRRRALRVNCANCGTEFLAKPSEVAKGWGKFCGRECKHAHSRKNPGTHSTHPPKPS